ncbi:MAG TPA: hypothetical protein VNO55_03945, partial [Polyangia bacterium]|nr:hypothetical protein [Polyangia bacterium]
MSRSAARHRWPFPSWFARGAAIPVLALALVTASCAGSRAPTGRPGNGGDGSAPDRPLDLGAADDADDTDAAVGPTTDGEADPEAG